jgi:DNA-directed RNA polymerase specialized sigma24 family protein
MCAESDDRTNFADRIPATDERAHGIIAGARQGAEASIDELVCLVYPELKRRARWLMRGERIGHTFGPSGSELVQRVMEKILETGGEIFNAASTEEELIKMLTRRMRFILVDYARSAGTHGKPNPRRRVPFDGIERSARVASVNLDEVLITHQALAKLGGVDPDAAMALELRVFAGLTNDEAAGTMGLSVPKFRRTLKFAMVFLKELLDAPAGSPPDPAT